MTLLALSEVSLPIPEKGQSFFQLVHPTMVLGMGVDCPMAVEAARVTKDRQYLAKGLDRLHLLTQRNGTGKAARPDRSRRTWGGGRGHSSNPDRAECKGVERRAEQRPGPAPTVHGRKPPAR